MLTCPHCKRSIEPMRFLSKATRRWRRRAGIPLDHLYCCTCRTYQRPEAFSKDPRPLPYLCDTCIDALLHDTPQTPHT